MAEFTKTNRDVYYANTEADSIAAQICIKKIRWVGPATAGDILEIDNGNGESILKAVAGTTLIDQDIDVDMWVTGLNLVDLDSGTVYIYIK